MSILPLMALAGASLLLGVPEPGGLTAAQRGDSIEVAGAHFRFRVDGARGGEITTLELFDGADWNRVLGADGQTWPMMRFNSAGVEYGLSNDSQAGVEGFEAGADLVKWSVAAVPRDVQGRALPWSVRLGYEVYPEGAVFLEMTCELPAGVEDSSQADVALVLDRAITGGTKYRQVAIPVLDDPLAFETARVAFGTDPGLSFTNEIEMMVEEKHALAGTTSFQSETGRFTWSLADGKTMVRGPFRYHNRLAMGLGSGAAGFQRSDLIGQRVYHWINYFRPDAQNEWYPANDQIDKMAANHATVLILHDKWMLNGGSNGNPHADYSVVRAEDALRRTIARAHAKGMRVGLYRRGIERYSLDEKLFEKYCQRDWDGFYVDWHGPQCIAYHEHRYPPEAKLGDVHTSADGSCLPAREYYLFLRQLRRIVGPRGFLIGHQGFGAAGVLPNLPFDAYLPGEAPFDRAMFADVDQAVWSGMMGGGVCHPWTLDSPAFVTPEGVARMAAWGFFPHVGLGMRRGVDGFVFPLEPDDPAVAFALPYWRVLAALNMGQARVFNLPNQKPVAATCADEKFRAVVYQDREQHYLVLVVNLSAQPAKTTVKLLPFVLGMTGQYLIQRVDSRTGAITPDASQRDRLETEMLPPWGIEGFRLTREMPRPGGKAPE